MSTTAVTGDEMLLLKSAAITTDYPGTTTTGGALNGATMTGGSVGEWFPTIPAPASGVLDTDFAFQYQKAGLANTNAHSHDLANAIWWVRNLLNDPAGAGAVKYQSTSPSDDGTVKMRHWINVGGSLVMEDVVLNGVTLVSGIQLPSRVYRNRALLTISDVATNLSGNLTTKVGTEQIGLLPSGYGWGTGELRFAMVATLYKTSDGSGETGTVANNQTSPGLTLSKPWNEATALPIRNSFSLNTLTAGYVNGIWGKEELQPFMPPIGRVDLVPHWKGAST